MILWFLLMNFDLRMFNVLYELWHALFCKLRLIWHWVHRPLPCCVCTRVCNPQSRGREADLQKFLNYSSFFFARTRVYISLVIYQVPRFVHYKSVLFHFFSRCLKFINTRFLTYMKSKRDIEGIFRLKISDWTFRISKKKLVQD